MQGMSEVAGAFLARGQKKKDVKRVVESVPTQDNEEWTGEAKSPTPALRHDRHNPRPMRNRKAVVSIYEDDKWGGQLPNSVRRKFVGGVRRCDMDGDDEEFVEIYRQRRAQGRILRETDEEDGDSGDEEEAIEARLAQQYRDGGMSEAPSSLFGSDEEAEYDERLRIYMRKIKKNPQYARNLRNYMFEVEAELDKLHEKYTNEGRDPHDATASDAELDRVLTERLHVLQTAINGLPPTVPTHAPGFTDNSDDSGPLITTSEDEEDSSGSDTDSVRSEGVGSVDDDQVRSVRDAFKEFQLVTSRYDLAVGLPEADRDLAMIGLLKAELEAAAMDVETVYAEYKAAQIRAGGAVLALQDLVDVEGDGLTSDDNGSIDADDEEEEDLSSDCDSD